MSYFYKHYIHGNLPKFIEAHDPSDVFSSTYIIHTKWPMLVAKLLPFEKEYEETLISDHFIYSERVDEIGYSFIIGVVSVIDGPGEAPPGIDEAIKIIVNEMAKWYQEVIIQRIKDE